jgi:hypothetical protein
MTVVPVPDPEAQSPVDVIEGGTEKITVRVDPDDGIPVFAFKSLDDVPPDTPGPALLVITPAAP